MNNHPLYFILFFFLFFLWMNGIPYFSFFSDNKLQELNASVNNEAVNSKANNTQAGRDNIYLYINH